MPPLVSLSRPTSRPVSASWLGVLSRSVHSCAGSETLATGYWTQREEYHVVVIERKLCPLNKNTPHQTTGGQTLKQQCCLPHRRPRSLSLDLGRYRRRVRLCIALPHVGREGRALSVMLSGPYALYANYVHCSKRGSRRSVRFSIVYIPSIFFSKV